MVTVTAVKIAMVHNMNLKIQSASLMILAVLSPVVPINSVQHRDIERQLLIYFSQEPYNSV
jgi:hypothetical protein